MLLLDLSELSTFTQRFPACGGSPFIYEPAHGIMALFVLRKLPYFMCANSEGSGKTAQMRRLA